MSLRIGTKQTRYIHTQWHWCVYRFRGTYDYVFVLDSDDFFNPVLKDHQIHFYVKNYCHENSIGSCAFKWVLYYPDCGLKSGPIEDGNVTSRLKSSKADVLIYTKSLHKTSALLDATFHYAAALMLGYKTVFVPMDVAYVAHVRHRWKLICWLTVVVFVINHIISHFQLAICIQTSMIFLIQSWRINQFTSMLRTSTMKVQLALLHSIAWVLYYPDCGHKSGTIEDVNGHQQT